MEVVLLVTNRLRLFRNIYIGLGAICKAWGGPPRPTRNGPLPPWGLGLSAGPGVPDPQLATAAAAMGPGGGGDTLGWGHPKSTRQISHI